MNRELRMKNLPEGDRGYALAPERGRVEIVYEYRAIELEKSKATVRNVLVGVDTETGEVLTVPTQSTPKLKAAREVKTCSPIAQESGSGN